MDKSTTKLSKKELCAAIGVALSGVKDTAPRIHCLTNAVALEFTANVLLAIGAEPTLTSAADEVASFVEGSAALLINLGMLDASRRKSMEIAIDSAQEHGKPWVLDPAYAQVSPLRFAFANTLIQRRPKIIRANKAEIFSLSGGNDAASLAKSIDGTVAATGEVDLITDGRRRIELANGDPLMAKVTAVGCVTSALAGAFLSVEQDHFIAAAITIAVAGIAGEIAAEQAQGPGSFRVAFIDALAALDADKIESRIKIV